MSDHTFCKMFLKEVMKDVKKAGFKAGDAWVYDCGYSGNKQFEFHGPNDHYNSCASTHCAWDAKANGWAGFLNTKE